MDPEPIRVLVVDDHPVVRDGVRGQLDTQPDLRVVGEAGTAEEAMAVLRTMSVDVVVTDLRMPGGGGLALLRSTRADHPTTAVLVLTTYDTDDDVVPALDAGVAGYLLKGTGREALAAAVRSVHEGRRVLDPSVQRRLRRDRTARPALSEREREVLQHVAAGRTNRQIGTLLFIGEATVKTHLQHIFTKLGATDRAAAVAAGYRRGLL